MTTLFAEDFDKICRCCLCKNGEMRPLFGSCIDNMLRFVAEIDVSVGVRGCFILVKVSAPVFMFSIK